MIMRLIGLLLTIVLIAWGASHYLASNETTSTETIKDAKGAVKQSQELQNKINNRAQRELSQ